MLSKKMRITHFLVVLFGVVGSGIVGSGIVSIDANADENYDIVYIDNGAVQCESKGLSEQNTAQILTDKGIEVIASQCGYLSGLAMAAQCGLADINIHLHTINTLNLHDAQALGFESVSTLKRDDDIGYIIIDCSVR
jgi:hypothetical protein